MKLISKLAVTSAVLTVAFMSTANAQSMRVSVPFGFRACEQVLPAGTYKVELSQSQRRITMRQLNGEASCFLPIKAFATAGKAQESALIFNRYGSSYFLSRVNTTGIALGAELFTSRAELEVAKEQPGGKPVVVSASGI